MKPTNLISNFHTHTYLCKHADGKPTDYVKEAVKGGCSALGFSDHCPYPDSSWAYCRMSEYEVNLYKSMVEEARSQAPFPVYFGFECEWHSRFKSWYKDFLRAEVQSDFLVLGSHWYEVNGVLEYAPNLTKKQLFGYIDFTIEGMASGLYNFLAHPDLFLAYTENIDADHEACSKAIIKAAVDFDMPIEINGYGTLKPKINRTGHDEYIYPVRRFWEIASGMGAKIICNSDAHFPEHTILGCRNAIAFAENMGIKTIDTAEALGFEFLDGSKTI